ncbi:MAG: hypothetical protein ACE5R6_02660 [Candidatus Heimdallarchaeota archaeon]
MPISRPKIRKLIIFSEMIPEPWVMNLGSTEDFPITPNDLQSIVEIARKGKALSEEEQPISHIDLPGMRIQWSESIDCEGNPIIATLITDEISYTAQAAIDGLVKMVARAKNAGDLTNIIMDELDSVLLYLMLHPSSSTDPEVIKTSYIGFDVGKVDGRRIFLESIRWSKEFEEFCGEIGVPESNLRRIITTIEKAPRPFNELRALSNIPREKLVIIIKYLVTAGVFTLLMPF